MNSPIYDELAARYGYDIPEGAGDIYNQPTPPTIPMADPAQMPPENEHAHGGDE